MLVSRSRLLADLDVTVTPDAPLGPRTWYGVGGRADLLVSPRSVDALATLVRRCRRSRTPVRLLGSGANLLVADEGVDGVVIRLDAPALTEMRYNPEGQADRMRIMAGADLARTLMDTVRRGLRGLHHLAGIPASIGGAIRMNAGGKYGDIGQAVTQVTVLDAEGRVRAIPAEALHFDYRTVNIGEPVILAADFHLEPDDPVRLRDEVKEIFAFKKTTQPLADHSAGCTFRNPVDPSTEQRVSAGKLIDDAGCKGLSIGEATVSDRHANFIVSKPGATATDVLRVLEAVRERVLAHSGIRLEEELVIWRREDDGGTLGAGGDDPSPRPRGLLDLDDDLDDGRTSPAPGAGPTAP